MANLFKMVLFFYLEATLMQELAAVGIKSFYPEGYEVDETQNETASKNNR